MLVLAPAACCLAGIGVDALLSLCLASLKAPDNDKAVRAPAAAAAAPSTLATDDRSLRRRHQKRSSQAGAPSLLPQRLLSGTTRLLPKEIAAAATLGLLAALIGYTVHCVWVSAEMYSAPSIVLQTRCLLFHILFRNVLRYGFPVPAMSAPTAVMGPEPCLPANSLACKMRCSSDQTAPHWSSGTSYMSQCAGAADGRASRCAGEQTAPSTSSMTSGSHTRGCATTRRRTPRRASATRDVHVCLDSACSLTPVSDPQYPPTIDLKCEIAMANRA